MSRHLLSEEEVRELRVCMKCLAVTEQSKLKMDKKRKRHLCCPKCGKTTFYGGET